jgi:hypothetical protein
MIDLFNAKALAASESRCAALERELAQTKANQAILAVALRKMDELAYRISQSSSPSQMQPVLAELVLNSEHRRKSESDRIASVIHTELNEARYVL